MRSSVWGSRTREAIVYVAQWYSGLCLIFRRSPYTLQDPEAPHTLSGKQSWVRDGRTIDLRMTLQRAVREWVGGGA